MVNVFTFIILGALFLEYVLGLVSSQLNLKSLRLEPPPELEGVYKPQEYRRSQEYTRASTRFGFVTSTFQLSLLLLFWFAGGFNYLDQIIRGWGYVPIVNGLLYIGILMMAHSLLMLPFSAYVTFVIEERFGFNRTTPRTFLLDRIKGLALAVLIGTPLLTGILALFEYAGPYAWLYCWALATTISLVIQFVAPIWIMPLFNKFTPLEAGELREALLNYARSAGYNISNIFVMDSSKRTSRSNAFFTGFGRSKRIALFDTLVEKHTLPELVAILAHEIGHYKKKHVFQGMAISIFCLGIIFLLLSVFLGSPGLYQAFYVEQPSLYAGLLFFGLLLAPLEILLSVLLNMLSRKNEYEADLFAAETIAEPRSLVDALKKLSADNLSNLTPHSFYVFLNYSHPPLLQRIHAIQQAPGSR
jgi:STE24 endopeptidase